MIGRRETLNLVLRKKNSVVIAAVSMLLVAALHTAHAQLRTFGGATAIVNVRIESPNQPVIVKGTLVLRDGLIAAVGTNVVVPKDADVIPGEGLVVYPGFVDCGFLKGTKANELTVDQDDPRDYKTGPPTAMREANRKGIWPDFRAATHLSLPESVIEPMRKSGFTSALIVPPVGLIRGRAALVNLSGRSRREAVVRTDAALCFSFSNAGTSGGYPGTPLGYFAQVRQALMDANHQQALSRKFEKSGGARPADDDALSALYGSINHKIPMLFELDSPHNIERAIDFQTEFGISDIVMGGLDAWKMADQLNQVGGAVIAAMDWGEEPKLDEVAKPPDNAAKASETTVPTPDDTRYLSEPVRKERRRLWLERVNNVAMLSKAGVPTAFTSRGLTSHEQFITNLRLMIANGLPRQTALAGLTTTPARLLGLHKQIGAVEPGMIANLTVMSGDFADAKSTVKYVFIDGRKFDPSAPKDANGTAPGIGGER